MCIRDRLSVLQKWVVKENDTWARVELLTNQFFEDPNRTKRGWIKI